MLFFLLNEMCFIDNEDLFVKDVNLLSFKKNEDYGKILNFVVAVELTVINGNNKNMVVNEI